MGLPDVPLPKMKDLLSIVARPPQRSPRIQNGRSQTYLSYDSEQTTPITEDKHFLDGQDQDERYESLPDQKVQDRLTPSPPPPPAAIEEDDHFGLADQIRGTPERSMKGGRRRRITEEVMRSMTICLLTLKKSLRLSHPRNYLPVRRKDCHWRLTLQLTRKK